MRIDDVKIAVLFGFFNTTFTKHQFYEHFMNNLTIN